jgi:hypothetical protein
VGPSHAPYSVVTGVIFPGVKRPGREVNDSPLSNTEVKNERSHGWKNFPKIWEALKILGARRVT